MNLTKQLAEHIRTIHFGGNWTSSNLKDNLADLTWEQATTKLHSYNTIASIAYHMNYYVAAILRELQGKPLDAKDEFSFNHPRIKNQEDWQNLLDKIWKESEMLADMVEELPDERLWENFSNEKHGTNYRNIQGIIEHNHYHLGQISILKRMITTTK